MARGRKAMKQKQFWQCGLPGFPVIHLTTVDSGCLVSNDTHRFLLQKSLLERPYLVIGSFGTPERVQSVICRGSSTQRRGEITVVGARYYPFECSQRNREWFQSNPDGQSDFQ